MRRWWSLALLLVSTAAQAHNGAVVANARFTSPPQPTLTQVDAGVVLAPLAIATADQQFVVSWDDGDNDPTGQFFFYYLDHCPSFAETPDQIRQVATPIPDGNGIWASCSCNGDQGVLCPDVTTRDCRNTITWDTHAVPYGTYWVLAINDDPPYLEYTVSGSPVRVQHTGDPSSPAVIVLRPDGFGSWDTMYRAQWYAVGTPPLRIDLSYGVDDATKVLNPTVPLGSDVHGIVNSDGTVSWDWDTSQLTNLGLYFLRVTVTDGAGLKAYSDSRFQLAVYHPNLDGGLIPYPDFAVPVARPPAAGCDAAGGGAWAVLAPLAIAFALLGLVLRRAR
jgi:hypothetical protein